MRLIALTLCLLPPLSAVAQSTTTDVGVVLILDPNSGIRFGDTVSLIVETTRPADMTGAPIYQDINVAGAIALAPEQSGSSFATRQGGQAMTTFRFRYAIIPQRVGKLDIPPVNIGWTADPGLSFQADGLSFDVATLPGVSDLRRVIVSPRATVSQTTLPDGRDVFTGDAIVRQIDIAADDAIALTLPAAEFDQIDGLAAYPDTPILNNASHRGTLLAKRTDRVTYIVEQPGTYTLPELTYEWWNTSRNRVEIVTLPAVSFDAVQGAAPDQPGVDDGAGFDWRSVWGWLGANGVSLAGGVFGLLTVVVTARRYGPVARSKARQWMSRATNSEPAVFHRLRRACADGNTPALRAAIWHWLEMVVPGQGPPTIAAIRQRLSDPDKAQFLDRVLSQPFAADANANPVSNVELKDGLSQLRKSLVHKNSRLTNPAHLQPLNPKA